MQRGLPDVALLAMCSTEGVRSDFMSKPRLMAARHRGDAFSRPNITGHTLMCQGLRSGFCAEWQTLYVAKLAR